MAHLFLILELLSPQLRQHATIKFQLIIFIISCTRRVTNQFLWYALLAFFFNERLSPSAEFIYPFKNWWNYYFQTVIMPPHLRDKDITSCPLGSQRRLQLLPSAHLAKQSETIIYETVSCRDEDKLCRESDKLSNADYGKVSLLYKH